MLTMHNWSRTLAKELLLQKTAWLIHSYYNTSFGNRASKNCEYKSLSPPQFSDIKYVIHLARIVSYLYGARKRQWLNICPCFSANIQRNETDLVFTWQRVWRLLSRIDAPDRQTMTFCTETNLSNCRTLSMEGSTKSAKQCDGTEQ